MVSEVESFSGNSETLGPIQKPDVLYAAICAGAVVLIILATWPFGGLSFGDDFSYAFTANVLARTGHLQYNGWATVALGPQALWGALFIKLFGFSFTVVRLSMLPVAAATAAVAYLLARLSGLKRHLAVLSTFLLVASPLFLPLSVSFMTDIGGLLFTFASLYCVISAGNSSSARRAILWIALSVPLVLCGGMVRQIVWVVALAGLPYLAVYRRRDVTVAACAVGAWLVVIAGIIYMMKRLSHTPYFIQETSVLGARGQVVSIPQFLTADVLGLVFTLTLLSLPIIPPLLVSLRRARPWRVGLMVLLLAIMMLVRTHWFAPKNGPWLNNILTRQGVMGLIELGPGRPNVLPQNVWAMASILVYAVLAWVVAISVKLPGRDVLNRTLRGLTSPSAKSWPLLVLMFFAAGYGALLIPRCAVGLAYDRYLLPLFPCVSIPVLFLYQRSQVERRPVGRAAMVLSWLILTMLGLFGIATTQELLALGRARVAAADEVEHAGIPRTSITNGMEYNFYTQLLSWGYLNDRRIRFPVDAYKPELEHCPVAKCPALIPRYTVQFRDRPVADFEHPTGFAPVRYFSLLPPLHRTLVVREIVQPVAQNQ